LGNAGPDLQRERLGGLLPGNKKDTRERERKREREVNLRGYDRQAGERERGEKSLVEASEDELTFGLAVGDQNAFYDTARAFAVLPCRRL